MVVSYALQQIRTNPAVHRQAMRLKDWSNNLLVPRHLRANHRHLSPQADRAFRAAVIRTHGEGDPEWEVSFRLTGFRNTVVPWLANAIKLAGCRILEVGCGTGASTLALAEQGAIVTGIDIDERWINLAKERAAAYGYFADLRTVDGSALPAERFDLIIFFASLEHMTQAERLKNLSEAWALLPSGGRLCVIETPNRLWCYDDHTSALPFFDWLPDDLALRYADRSPRLAPWLGGREVSDEALMDLRRAGRGLSFHEFEVAGIPTHAVESCMVEFLRRNPLYAAKYHLSSDRAFSRLLHKQAPNVARPFFYHRLDLLIRKA